MRLDKLIIMQMLTDLLSEPYDFTYQDARGGHTIQFTPGGVYRGRKTVSVEDNVAYAISVLEAPRATIGSPADVEGRQRAEDWTLNVQGWPPEDREHPSDPAYVMAAAVRQRMAKLIDSDRETGAPLFPEWFMFNKMVHNIQFGATIVTPATAEVSKVAFWYMPVVVSLVQQTRTR